ncbi:hypothetical protein [Anaerotignum propionicum]|uniref:DUF3168 domain-containing protein n=1 Tax=Anaerotignum propionicum DSM 1682 TaxID=991789 RepID=A0A110A771_ANAPI|nr:hypothetical protein [Anaerotignum propionicum]AMJ41692.1 hypothetical protein CPRO_21120 [Anaerotignum propionicum DSM 1682]AMJ42329.1 hypothetical protein CPRO_27830 [Anaerotignum propionicum DSM 1682]SHE82542.1 hypothetical protein SAMN02745151_01890 [[Clostridium] propionicum DSM 1682] [Anaerotignum propionicum DSM 1682]SHE99653.1 hypothetical protein SAMN02745151_02439 [[Clostridium] propionicum DSM 1682] [Anaerotignum propionicum DSM 1682]
MLNEILTILKADSELYSLLGATVSDSKIYMNQGKAETCISYKYSIISSDGIKAQSKLEMNCISPDYGKAESILSRVKQLLITVGNKQLNNDILNVALNGGGSLFIEETKQHIIKAYFILSIRERMI